MKKLFLTFFIVANIYPAFAVDSGIENNFSNEMNGIYKNNVVDDVFNKDLSDIEQEIYKLSPDIVNKNAEKTDDEKLIIYRSFLAEKAYEWYKAYFLNKITERANSEPNRKLLKDYDDDYAFWHLDEGVLDEPECKVSDKKSWCYGESRCVKPHDLDSVWFHFDYKKDILDNEREMLFVEDDAKNNVRYIYSVIMQNIGSCDNELCEHDFFMDISGHVDDYETNYISENKGPDFCDRYKQYSESEFKKLRDKSSKAIMEFDPYNTKTDTEINNYLKEQGLPYNRFTDDNIADDVDTMIMGKSYGYINLTNKKNPTKVQRVIDKVKKKN